MGMMGTVGLCCGDGGTVKWGWWDCEVGTVGQC